LQRAFYFDAITLGNGRDGKGFLQDLLRSSAVAFSEADNRSLNPSLWLIPD
jgi:hypothetical protein